MVEIVKNDEIRSEIDRFLERKKGPAASAYGQGRLIFALDATASRQSTWDMACDLQRQMFQEAAAIGRLSIQLVYYRGLEECRASRWVSESGQLSRLMERLDCRAGKTQIEKVLNHTQREARILPVSALVFVGDAMEESIDRLVGAAGELSRLRIPAFIFQEGDTPQVERAFREIARATGGAYCRFEAGAAKSLSELLRAVAAFALGGRAALEGRKDEASIKLLGQLK
jgi:hypothetical protein